MSTRSLILLLLLLTACGGEVAPRAKQAVPQIRATVITIRSTFEPGRRPVNHSLVIARGIARALEEQDVWHLYDTNTSTVTTVDTVERTKKTEPLDVLKRRRQAALRGRTAAFIPHVSVRKTGEKRTLHGAEAEQWLITAGAYSRELWVAEHPLIPPSLFAMMSASVTPSSPLAPMTRGVDEALEKLRGYPFLDATEVPYGKAKMVVRHEVVAIAERDVPAAMLEVPRGYRDLGEPAAARPARRP